MPTIIPIDDSVAAIDHDLFGMPGIGVTYVVRGDPDQVALIETGTSLTAEITWVEVRTGWGRGAERK